MPALAVLFRLVVNDGPVYMTIAPTITVGTVKAVKGMREAQFAISQIV